MLEYIAEHVPELFEIWVGDNGFHMKVGGTTRGHLFIRHAAGGNPTWQDPDDVEMPVGKAWWHWQSGYVWPDSFDLVALDSGGKLAAVPSGGQLDKFTSKTFPAGTVGHPQVKGDKVWKLTLVKQGAPDKDVGFLRRMNNGTLTWSAHKDSTSENSRIDCRTDTLQFRPYTHDTSCEEWCHDGSPCGPIEPFECGIHSCASYDVCEAHATDCPMNNNYRQIVSSTE